MTQNLTPVRLQILRRILITSQMLKQLKKLVECLSSKMQRLQQRHQHRLRAQPLKLLHPMAILVVILILVMQNIMVVQVVSPLAAVAAEVAVLKRIKRNLPMRLSAIMSLRNSLIICLVNMTTYPQPRIGRLEQIAYGSWIKKPRSQKNRSPHKNVMLMRLILIILKTAQQLPHMGQSLTKMALLLTMNKLCKNSQISLMPHLRMKPKNLITILKRFSINMKKLQSLNYLKLTN